MQRTVLIIEDEKLIIVSTQMVLEAAGFRVESATNGEDGIAKAKGQSPDLILLDIMMPGIDGWETLTRLKRDAATAGIPVVIFTAREHSRGHQKSAEMGAAAVAAAQAVGYVGAGTVEFIAEPYGDGDLRFYFMEMNTRLQVEHAVTEAITGLDLVAWQLRVAAGEPLPMRQEELRFHGHAIEVRLCAEDPQQNFMPQSGRMLRWQMPETGPAALRVDHALRSGDEIPPYYDSMIAKLVSHGATRDEARRKLLRGLRETLALGVTTNQSFLADALAHPVFAAGGATTAFIGQHGEALLARPPEALSQRAAAVAAVLLNLGPGRGHALPLVLSFTLDGQRLHGHLTQRGADDHVVQLGDAEVPLVLASSATSALATGQARVTLVTCCSAPVSGTRTVQALPCVASATPRSR
mgnify:CR=1 FL=1